MNQPPNRRSGRGKKPQRPGPARPTGPIPTRPNIGSRWMSAGETARRLNVIRIIVVVAVALLMVRLAWVQLIIGPDLAAEAQDQRRVVVVEPAKRGSVVDTNGEQLAYTMMSRSLTVQPDKLESFMQRRHELYGTPEPEQRMKDIARELPRMLGDKGKDIKSKDILKKLKSDTTYAVLVRNVDPDVAVQIVEKFPEIYAERQDVREYPGGAVAANVIGKISTEGSGQFGLELSQDAKLQGQNGSYTVDVANRGMAIPGSRRDDHPPVDGDSLALTLDQSLQTYVQQALEQAKENSKAESASAVVLDAKTGKVLSMATTDTINPSGDISKQLEAGKEFGNRTISTPFEPGSVAKIVTAAAAIENHKTTPDEVLQVPGSIEASGVTVHDAWEHGVAPYTTTGVFGKSSNVGTLMLAERVGPDVFDSFLHKFGIGDTTGIGLPNESAGQIPPKSQWTAGTFANLPIGQGFSVTLLQMAGIYQAIANDGVRVEPRIIKSITQPDGTVVEPEKPKETRVVSTETARTVRDMFRSVVQKDNGRQQGTGVGAAIEGYQVSGKTGTAQQIDPDTGAYSNSKYWITFAGIAPADNPRFVVALMLDNPQRGVHGEGGQSAAPLFHDIASWALNHYNIPPSKEPGSHLLLEAGP